MKKHIPNFITLLNLSAGFFAVLLASKELLIGAAMMVVVAAIFDFFDGLAARLLNAKSNIGKELDSLADVVSFGVAPAVIIYYLIDYSKYAIIFPHVLIVVLFPCFVALRLAKFNLDERQTTVFYGLPSPAAAFVLISLPFFPSFEYAFFVYAIIILLLGILMLSNIRLFSLKFTNFSIRDNIFRYFLLIISLALIAFLQLKAFPFIILTYIILSIINNRLNINSTDGN